ncbi:hypothetical protein D1820_16885 [Phaeobacter sp. LSS9]|uniref:DUF5906 domain-containing protein n=1 Tax=unclassified Phaeobacter TaxID=2621772 RepID=UPI000E52AFE5|nr:DUF5906 domain-containing protein [Phaeobacter sp. LSS9]AXT36523.1 hypothetical protein D1820_16885 [Phaeobacter sp. LSS9]
MSVIDFKKLEARIAHDPETFLRAEGYHGEVVNGEFITGDIHGNPGKSFGVNLVKALFNDLNDAEGRTSGKGWINLIAKKLTMDRRAAAAHIVEMMCWNADDFEPDEKPPKRKSGDLVMPVPSDAPEIPYRVGDALKSGSDIMLTSIYVYRNAEGELLHYVLRFEEPATGDGKPVKEIRPLYYFGPEIGWKMKGPQKAQPTTLFGLEELERRPFDPVLLVEGEKTALAARDLFSSHVCITWPGGAGRLSKADWSPLSGRHVVYWPDADDAGHKTIAPIQRALGLIVAASLKVVQVSSAMPNKWDLADPPPGGVELAAMLSEAKPLDLTPLKLLLEMSYSDLAEQWYFIVETEEFIHLPTGLTLTKQAFDAMYRHLSEAQRGSIGNRFLEDYRDNKLVKRVYHPGETDEIVVVEKFMRALNTWRPSEVAPVEGDASTFVDHLRYLAGNERDFSHLADMLAFMVQKPGEKLKSAAIIVGKQGTGKSYVGDVLRILLGEHNCSVIETNELKSEYSGYMEDRVCVIIEELMAPGRRDVLNSLKPKITQLLIPLRKKYANKRDIPNTVNFIAFSNFFDALPLDYDDRRYFVVGTDAERRDVAYYNRLWGWTEKSYGVILNWLLKRDLSKFNPNAKPPMTAAKREMTQSSRPVVEAEIARMIAEREPPFDLDLVEIKRVLQVLSDYMREANLSAVQKGLKANGAKNLGQKKALIQGREQKVSLWVVRDVAKWERKPNAAIARAYFERQSGPDADPDCLDLFVED